jgi:serine protease Do
MFFNYFNNMGPVTSSGSGVIISPDGYLITNYHVVKDADRIEIVVNNRKKNYKAEVIGFDPSSDLALIKIDEKNLPFIEFANSDSVLVGEWVLAIGNPFNLTSTVTSGIVSAKGRNINVNKNSFPIESFIQTDAAINPGNSGGALVNTEGKLIGINSAILSKTGSYAGYGFAIPSNIVKKVINDLKKFGMIQRAFLEADITEIDEEISKKTNHEDIQGVYVNKVTENSNAAKAGLKQGDLILKVNNVFVNSRGTFDEQIAYCSPGDKITLEVLRDDKIINIDILLTNSEGTTNIVKNTTISSKKLGASFIDLTKTDKDYFGLEYGVKVSSVKNGPIAQMSIPEGYIILSINKKNYSSAAELVKDLESYQGWLTIKGVTPDGWLDTRTFRIL